MKFTTSLFERKLMLLAVASVLLLPLPQQAGQDAPRLIPFQGRLTDQNGLPVSDGIRVVQFKIYDAPVGGQAVWNGEVQKLTVNGGLVSTALGGKASLASVDFNRSLYLELTIDANGDAQITAADPPMLPRQAILPAVFSKESANSRLLAGFDWSAVFGVNDPVNGKLSGSRIQTNSITGAQIAAATITSGQLANGAVTANQLAPASVTGSAIANGAVDSQQIAQGAVQTANLGGGVVTLTNLAQRQVGTNAPVGGVAVSPLISTNFSDAGNSGTIVPGLTATLVTSGRPVMVLLNAGSTNGVGMIQSDASGGYWIAAEVFFIRNGSQVSDQRYAIYGITAPSGYIPPSVFQFIDFPPAGTNTYSISIGNEGVPVSLRFFRVQLVAFEL